MTPDMILPVSVEEFEKSGSKFITFPPGAQQGDVQYRDIECGLPDWDTPDVSLKFPVTITEEGDDLGKTDKMSPGVQAGKTFKLKDILGQLGIAYKDKAGKMTFNTDDVAGKAAVGVWTMQKGRKGGVADAEIVWYPKLTDILAAGSKPEVEELT